MPQTMLSFFSYRELCPKRRVLGSEQSTVLGSEQSTSGSKQSISVTTITFGS